MVFRLLSEADVRSAMSIADLLEPMAHALDAFSRHAVVQPVRSVVSVSAGPGLLGLMPAHLPEEWASPSRTSRLPAWR